MTAESDLYLVDTKTGERQHLSPHQGQVEYEPEEFDPSGEWLYCRTNDGGEFYKPQDASAATKAPAIVWVHGGPGGQTRAGYSALLQFLANHGYVILGINNRGSSGCGRTFFTADDGKHGGGRRPASRCTRSWVTPRRTRRTCARSRRCSTPTRSRSR